MAKLSSTENQNTVQTSLFDDLRDTYTRKEQVSSIEGCGGQCGSGAQANMCCTKVQVIDKDGSLVKTSYKCMKKTVTDLFDGF